VGNNAAKRSGLFGLFGKRIDPNERQPGQKLAAPNFEKPEKIDKRAISGNCVVCLCSMQLPKVNTFNQLKIHRKGYLIFNARGGAFYISPQFTESNVTQLFNLGEPGIIKNFKLYPHGRPEVSIGQISARFLFFTQSQALPGMDMRFGNMSERQLGMLNTLVGDLPKVGPNEYAFIQKALGKRQ
jgi:hypothetical protein